MRITPCQAALGAAIALNLLLLLLSRLAASPPCHRRHRDVPNDVPNDVPKGAAGVTVILRDFHGAEHDVAATARSFAALPGVAAVLVAAESPPDPPAVLPAGAAFLSLRPEPWRPAPRPELAVKTRHVALVPDGARAAPGLLRRMREVLEGSDGDVRAVAAAVGRERPRCLEAEVDVKAWTARYRYAERRSDRRSDQSDRRSDRNDQNDWNGQNGHQNDQNGHQNDWNDQNDHQNDQNGQNDWNDHQNDQNGHQNNWDGHQNDRNDRNVWNHQNDHQNDQNDHQNHQNGWNDHQNEQNDWNDHQNHQNVNNDHRNDQNDPNDHRNDPNDHHQGDHCALRCGALDGAPVVLLLRTRDLFSLPFPLSRPVVTSVSLQASLRGWRLLLLPDIFPAASRPPPSPHSRWKSQTTMEKLHRNLMEEFGIKLEVLPDGRHRWHGCTKDTPRCFGTVHAQTPQYLLTGRWTPPCCLRALRLTARHVLAELEAAGVRHWLEGGSLLGAVRLGDIIPWDYDVDVGLYREDVPKCRWLAAVAATGRPVEDPQGFFWEKASEGEFYRVHFSRANRLHVDLWPFYRRRGGVMTKDTWLGHRQDVEFPERFLVPLGAVGFAGGAAKAPNDPRAFLELKFGPGVVENPEYPNPGVRRLEQDLGNKTRR